MERHWYTLSRSGGEDMGAHSLCARMACYGSMSSTRLCLMA
jgi:hypothetical protein